VTEAEWIAFLQWPEIPAFNRAMLQNPDDDLPRLVFADWMDENCPDREVCAAVRRSITSQEQRSVWPGLRETPAWRLTFHRARIAMWVNWVDRHPAPPPHRRPRTLLEAVWRTGWVEVAEFGRGQYNSLEGWFSALAMRGVTAVSIGGSLLFPDHLSQLLASPELLQVDSLTLNGWQPGSDFVAVLIDAPIVSRIRTLNLKATPLNPSALATLVRHRCVTRLETLSLSLVSWLNCDESAAVLANSAQLRNLKHLLLESHGITDAGAAALANSPYLCEAIRAQWRRPADGGANR
jgi:uncharacterized protein (TIGR02996 family)